MTPRLSPERPRNARCGRGCFIAGGFPTRGQESAQKHPYRITAILRRLVYGIFYVPNPNPFGFDVQYRNSTPPLQPIF